MSIIAMKAYSAISSCPKASPELFSMELHAAGLFVRRVASGSGRHGATCLVGAEALGGDRFVSRLGGRACAAAVDNGNKRCGRRRRVDKRRRATVRRACGPPALLGCSGSELLGEVCGDALQQVVPRRNGVVHLLRALDDRIRIRLCEKGDRIARALIFAGLWHAHAMKC